MRVVGILGHTLPGDAFSRVFDNARVFPDAFGGKNAAPVHARSPNFNRRFSAALFLRSHKFSEVSRLRQGYGHCVRVGEQDGGGMLTLGGTVLDPVHSFEVAVLCPDRRVLRTPGCQNNAVGHRKFVMLTDPSSGYRQGSG